MDNLWSFLWQSLTLSVVGALLLLVKRLLADKLSPRWQYGVWLIFLLRAFLPAGLGERALIPGGRVLLELVKGIAEGGLSSLLTDPWTATAVSAPIPLFPQGLPWPGSVTDLLFYLYALGGAALLLWFIAAYLRLRRRIARRGIAPDGEVLRQLEEVARQHHLPCPKRVVVLEEADSAFVCGFLRPVLVLPRREVDEKVLLHELLHLRYGDVWAGAVICLVRCLHWCNPLVWLCCNRMQNDCESLCDQRVLERLEGEERRQYGVILLSMADDRYARAPGTSSMANGGRNIKRRIAAIARFKRYPAGMALASVCVAAVLAVTCLAGSGAASSVELSATSLPLAMAQARVSRATTVAGALDTYAKAILTDNGAALAMVTPEEKLPALAEALSASTRWQLGLYAFLEAEDVPSWRENWAPGMAEPSRSYVARWMVYNLLPQGDDRYTGLLVLDCSPWASEEDVCVFFQEVQVEKEDGYVVTPLSDWDHLRAGTPSVISGSDDLPVLTYRAEAAGKTIEISIQHLLEVYSPSQQNDSVFFFSSPRTYSPDMTLTPQTWYTGALIRCRGEARSTDTGLPVDIGGRFWCLTAEEAENWTGGVPDKQETSTFSLPSHTYSGMGTSSLAGIKGLVCAPAALLLEFTRGGQTYTCLARLEGGAQ